MAFWRPRPNERNIRQELADNPADENWAERIWDTRLEDADYFVVDIETSGFSAMNDKVLSLAAGCARGSDLPCVIDQYDIVRHERVDEIPELIWQLTGLSREDIEGGKEWRDVLFRALSLSANRVWIAHHARHEVSFLQRHTRLLWKTQIHPIVVDTAVVAQSLLRLGKVPTLDFVCEWLGIPITNRHCADEDVLMTAAVWKREIELCQSIGLETVGNVIEWSISHAGA